jgi:hypothetical protein
MVFVLPFIAAVAYGDEKRPEELSRQYIDDFLSGDLKTLFDKASPELREAIKNVDALKALRAGSVGEAAKVVIDVAQIEMRFEEIGLQADRALVQRLGLGQLVATVVDIRKIDERRHEIRIQFQRLAIFEQSLFEQSHFAQIVGMPAVNHRLAGLTGRLLAP